MAPIAARRIAALTIISTLALPAVAQAQAAGDGASLMEMSVDSLRDEIGKRYDAALAASTDPAIVNATDPRYLWANEAKIQCGIAIGFLKSRTKDPASIGKCARASALMNEVPAAPPPPAPPPPPPPARPSVCDDRTPRIVFFDFDSDVPPPSASDTLGFISQNASECGWSGLNIAGHTDLSGSDAYNQDLSRRRAEAIASELENAGVSPEIINIEAFGESMPRVPTADGVRNPQNRRVEVTIK